MTRLIPATLTEIGRGKLASLRLLIVDPNDGTRRMLCELLRGAGIGNIITVSTAQDALAALVPYDPDVVIFDWELPGLSGIDLIKRIRCAARHADDLIPDPKIAAIMITSRRRERDVIEARNAGIDEFVLRPYSMTGLTKALVAVLKRRRPFVVSEAFIGPDRRRRRTLAYNGKFKRESDIETAAIAVSADNVRREISIECLSLKALMRARKGLHAQTLEHMVRQLIEAGRQAQEVRLGLIEQATRSLSDYCELWGDAADPEVIDVHLDALINLSQSKPQDVTLTRAEGGKIVRNLNSLVKQRQKHLRQVVPQP